jgi:ABC-type amino acid transport substrate-binding protein
MGSCRKKTAVLAVVGTLGALVSGLLAPAAAAGSLVDVRARGKLVVLSFPHQESSFVRVDVERGLGFYEGIDVDLMTAFASSLGVELEIHPVRPTFAALVPALLAGEGDVIATSFTITAERRARMLFSEPYFTVYAVVLAKKERGFASVADLAGKVGSSVQGSSLHERMKALPGVKLHFVDFTRWNYDAVAADEADFTVVDETGTGQLLPLYPELGLAFRLPGTDHYGYALAPGAEDLRAALDAFLVEARKSGRLDEIVRRHLGDGVSSGLADIQR